VRAAVKEKRHRMVNPDDVDVAKRCVEGLWTCGVAKSTFTKKIWFMEMASLRSATTYKRDGEFWDIIMPRT
jgi:hypothetical protein